MIQDRTDKDLLSAYRQEDESLRIHRSSIGCILTLILMPASSIVDFFIYKDHLRDFFRIRLLVDLIVGAILAIHFTNVGRRYIRELGLTWLLLLNVSFCWMIFVTEGPVSPYYAALNLILLSVAALLPWTMTETLFASIATIMIYLTTCYMYSGMKGLIINQSIFFNNLYFIVLSGILCTTTNYFSTQARFQDFLLRHELDIKNKKLRDLDRLKSRFFANVSHELRTPLTLILAPVNNLLAKGGELPGTVHESLLVVQKNALRLLKLINELLDVMRLEEKSMVLSKETIDLSSFVPGIVDSVRHLANSKDLTIRTERPSCQVFVSGDPNRLEKVFLNLLSNAIKFTPKGGEIIIRIYIKDRSAMIEVSDTGIGIDREELPLIFDRFHQVDGGAARTYQGVGIGLSLARDLIEKQGGTLTAESENGKGAAFIVSLPRMAQAESEQIVSKPIETVKEEPFAAAFKSADHLFITGSEAEGLYPIGKGKHTVLVVDDEPDMLHFLVSIISSDYRVIQATCGERALALAQKEQPDLILLDWMLPGMSGLEVCSKIRHTDTAKDIKIILLTARIDESSKISALKEGADDFLTKPFSAVELSTRIANLIRTASLQNDLRKRNAELNDTLSRLRETESQLVQSEKMNALGTLSAGLLHEINNPLNFCLTAIQVGRNSLTRNDNELLETLDDIEDGMKRISGIVSDLHTFAYPERTEHITDFRIMDVMTSSMRLAARELQRVTVKKNLNPEVEIRGSQTQITHLLINLLVNAGKAVKDRKCPQISISGQRINGRYKISVHDNGIGIKADIIDRVFEPFFTTSDVGKGMGLGLSMCHTIVANHGGKIHAESRENEWTEISFDLPISS